MEKLATGLFHFNVQYVAGNLQGYHRYCTEVIIPFLGHVARRPWFRTTIEISGTGLEFLAEHYPLALEQLKDLVSNAQLELISSTYAPTAWIAFPRRDLERSIAINQQCLARLGVRNSSIFFSQEGFVGEGLSCLPPGTIVVCKDDSIEYQSADSLFPIYNLGSVKIVVGSSHVINEFSSHVLSTRGTEECMPAHWKRRINRAISQLPFSAYVPTVVADGMTARWYHLGSAHHLTTPTSPLETDCFFHDVAWANALFSMLSGWRDAGTEFATVGALCARLNWSQAGEMPRIVESSWNGRRSLGVYKWMGNQGANWENTQSLLALAWRSRSMLRGLEKLIQESPSHLRYAPTVQELWKRQVLAESSDPLGWTPQPCEVGFGRNCAESVYQEAGKLYASLSPKVGGELAPPDLGLGEKLAGESSLPPCQGIIIGGEGDVSWVNTAEGDALCDVEWVSTATETGIVFPRSGNAILYCPSGAEEMPSCIPDLALKQNPVYLPLVNGLINLADDMFLIRINVYGMVAAAVDKVHQNVSFLVSNIRPGVTLHWRFLIVRGTISRALEIANRENCI